MFDPAVIKQLHELAEQYKESQEQLKKYMGRSIKLQLKAEPEPIYFKIMGYAFNGQSFWGLDDEGAKRFIKVDEVEGVIE